MYPPDFTTSILGTLPASPLGGSAPTPAPLALPMPRAPLTGSPVPGGVTAAPAALAPSDPLIDLARAGIDLGGGPAAAATGGGFDWTQALLRALPALAAAVAVPFAGGQAAASLGGGLFEGMERRRLEDEERQAREQQAREKRQREEFERRQKLLGVIDTAAQRAVSLEDEAAGQAYLDSVARLLAPLGVDVAGLRTLPSVGAQRKLVKDARATYDAWVKMMQDLGHDPLDPEVDAKFTVTFRGKPMKPSELAAIANHIVLDPGQRLARPVAQSRAPFSDYGRFEADFLEAEAAKRGKAVADLTAAERVALKIEARRVFGRADDAERRPWAPIVIQTQTGPAILDRTTRTVSPITDGQGKPLGPLPTAEMRNRAEALDKTLRSVRAVKALGDRIIQRVGPAQRLEAVQRGAAAVFGHDPEFRAYQDARMGLAGNLAVLQQGSRPSDADIRAIWLPLVPDPYTDTAESAAIKWQLIEAMSGLGDLPATPPPGQAGAASGRNLPRVGEVRTLRDGTRVRITSVDPVTGQWSGERVD